MVASPRRSGALGLDRVRREGAELGDLGGEHQVAILAWRHISLQRCWPCQVGLLSRETRSLRGQTVRGAASRTPEPRRHPRVCSVASFMRRGHDGQRGAQRSRDRADERLVAAGKGGCRRRRSGPLSLDPHLAPASPRKPPTHRRPAADPDLKRLQGSSDADEPYRHANRLVSRAA
jgi:hypothetical protein